MAPIKWRLSAHELSRFGGIARGGVAGGEDVGENFEEDGVCEVGYRDPEGQRGERKGHCYGHKRLLGFGLRRCSTGNADEGVSRRQVVVEKMSQFKEGGKWKVSS